MVNNLQYYPTYNLPYNIQATTSHIEILQTLHILMVNYVGSHLNPTKWVVISSVLILS